MAENMDAWPHPGQDWPRLTGTYLQAWSNSEQLRAWYQYFLGVRPDLIQGAVTLAPRLPQKAGGVVFEARVGAGGIEAEYRPREEGWTYRWKLRGTAARLLLDLPGFTEIPVEAGEGDLLTAQLRADRLDWSLSNAVGELRLQGNAVPDPGLQAQQSAMDALFSGIRFAVPGDPLATPVMQGPRVTD